MKKMAANDGEVMPGGLNSFNEETLDVRAIDWNRVWAAQRAKRGKKKDKTFWNGRSTGFLKGASETAYAEQFMTLINPDPSWHILDMGCGTGTLTIPLAQRVHKVTAVDFSPSMLDALKVRADAENICNIKLIEGRWEDDWQLLGIESCDCAIASRSLVADDLKGSIEKLAAVASKRVCIVTIAGDGPFDRSIFDAIGRPLVLGPDYICNYNMLYSLGITANVTFIIEERNREYESIDEAVESIRWMFDDLTAHEEVKLRYYLEGLMKKHNDGSFTIHHCTHVKWAVIWWDKGTKVK